MHIYNTHCIDAWLLLGISIKASETGEMVLPPLTLDVDTSAFFRKLLTELSATLLSRILLSEIAHTESL